jgi:pimeloyl-ACP methyl ester carboxylesterase
VAATLFAMANRTEYCGGVAREIEGFQDDIVASAPPEALGDLPLVVLSRGRPSRAQDFAGAAVTPEYLTDVDRVWAALQAELAGLSTRSVQRVVVDSGHAIPLEAPDAVVDAVRDVLQTSAGSRARAPSAAASQVPSSSE